MPSACRIFCKHRVVREIPGPQSTYCPTTRTGCFSGSPLSVPGDHSIGGPRRQPTAAWINFTAHSEPSAGIVLTFLRSAGMGATHPVLFSGQPHYTLGLNANGHRLPYNQSARNPKPSAAQKHRSTWAPAKYIMVKNF